MIALLAAVFLAPIAAGAGMGVWSWWRPRVLLARAFRAGRTDHVVRLPAPRPVDAWPVYIAMAGEAA